MTLPGNWKNWSKGLCIAAILAGPAIAQELQAQDGAPVVEDVTEGPLTPMPLVDEEPPSPEPAGLKPLVDEATPDNVGGSAGEATPAPLQIEEKPAEASKPEIIEERFPNGKVKIVREVIQDGQGNYLNHGQWRELNERGGVVMEGRMKDNERHGVWNRWYAGGEVAFLRQRPYTDFSPPFVSQGIFEDGQLHGAWIIYDAKHRKVSEIRFNRGEREGVATWWHPSGRKMREMKFEGGIINGLLQEWGADGALVSSDLYDKGRKLTTSTTYFAGTLKKTSGQYLEPELVAKTLDDWHKGEMATYSSTGKPIKHGKYTVWHQNGQIRLQGEYKYDVPVGTFTWWYANGQKTLEGRYEEGKQEGEWSWWHENGQRSIRGFFTSGNPSGKWTWWSKEGKVAQAGDFSDDKGHLLVMPAKPALPVQKAEVPANAIPKKR